MNAARRRFVGAKYKCPVFSKVEMSAFPLSIRHDRVSAEEPIADRRSKTLRRHQSRSTLSAHRVDRRPSLGPLGQRSGGGLSAERKRGRRC